MIINIETGPAARRLCLPFSICLALFISACAPSLAPETRQVIRIIQKLCEGRPNSETQKDCARRSAALVALMQTRHKSGHTLAAEAAVLLNELRGLNKPANFYLVGPAVCAVLLSGDRPRLYKILSEHRSRRIRLEGNSHLMSCGRLGAFGVVKKNGQSRDPELRRTAMLAALRMNAYTPAEKDIVCPWAYRFLRLDQNPTVRSAAARHRRRHCEGH